MGRLKPLELVDGPIHIETIIVVPDGVTLSRVQGFSGNRSTTSSLDGDLNMEDWSNFLGPRAYIDCHAEPVKEEVTADCPRYQCTTRQGC